MVVNFVKQIVGSANERYLKKLGKSVDAINALEPDLYEYTPAGWTYPIVPRATNDATSNSAVLGAAALPGNLGSGTYFNWANWNSSSSLTPTVSGPDQTGGIPYLLMSNGGRRPLG